MGLNLALATAALAVVVHSPPADSAAPQGESFIELAERLDVATVAPPPPSAEPADSASGIPEPGTWSLLAMGLGVVALIASRTRR